MEKDKFWEYFDDDSKEYVQTIMEAEGDFYKKSGILINEDLAGEWKVLDIGNGGIINYDAEKLKHLDCADIYLNENVAKAYKNVPNISFIKSDITNMITIADETYDAVIVQNVLHHLAEKTHKQTQDNCKKAILECTRVLKRGGVLIICESTVKRWFECLEIIFFGLMMRLCDLVKFDRVYQYSSISLKALLEGQIKDKCVIEKVIDVGQGKYVLFLGRKMPSKILPLSVTYYLIRKQDV